MRTRTHTGMHAARSMDVHFTSGTRPHDLARPRRVSHFGITNTKCGLFGMTRVTRFS